MSDIDMIKILFAPKFKSKIFQSKFQKENGKISIVFSSNNVPVRNTTE